VLRQALVSVVAVWFCACSITAFSQSDNLLSRARSLLDAGKAPEAFAILEPQTEKRAGDPDFDYLLGVAALDAKRPGIAVIALERALIARPDHPQARAEIARAYFELGETRTAQQEFESVKRSGVPPAVAATIDKYLDAIGKRLEGATVVRGFVEAGVGMDSNINNATGSSQIALPAFGGAAFTLNAAGQRQHGIYSSVGGGLNVSTPLASDLRLLAGVSGTMRSNGSKDNLDTRVLDGNLGLAWELDPRNLLSAGIQVQQFDLDNKRFRTSAGVNGQWQHNLADDRQLSVFGQYSDLSYPGQDLRNADRMVAGVGYVQAFPGNWSPVGYVTGYIGREQERAQNVAFLGHVLQGARAGITLKPADNLGINLNLSHESRHYGGQEPLFLTGRVDRQLDLRASLDYALRRDITVSPFFGYTENQSNIVINKYGRKVFGVTVRMEF